MCCCPHGVLVTVYTSEHELPKPNYCFKEEKKGFLNEQLIAMITMRNVSYRSQLAHTDFKTTLIYLKIFF